MAGVLHIFFSSGITKFNDETFPFFAWRALNNSRLEPWSLFGFVPKTNETEINQLNHSEGEIICRTAVRKYYNTSMSCLFFIPSASVFPGVHLLHTYWYILVNLCTPAISISDLQYLASCINAASWICKQTLIPTWCVCSVRSDWAAAYHWF